MYGKGRVFYGSFAHTSATWDIRDIQQMYFEAIKWSLGLTDGEVKPHPMTSSHRARRFDKSRSKTSLRRPRPTVTVAIP